MIIMRRDIFRLMREGLEKLVGDQAAPFLSFLASGIGIHEGSIFRESVQAPNERERRNTLKGLIQGALEDTNLGLGKVMVSGIDFDKGEAVVTIANCFEALENGSFEEPNCMFTSGFLAGVFAEVLDKTVRADEVKCISKGEPQCEFHISPASEEHDSEGTEAGTRDEVKGSDEGASGKAGPSQTQGTGSVGEKVVAPSHEPKGPSDTGLPDFDSGVEKASRIARRKQRFWDRLFK